MPATELDVVIVGGGLVGLALARALSDSGLTIGLVEREAAAAPPEIGWDVRVYAISPGSESFLRSLDAWPGNAQRMAPVERMCIFGDRPGSKLEFDAYRSHVSRLATIVENRLLMQALRHALDITGKVERFQGERCAAVQWEADAATLQLQTGTALRARLLVGADGADSWLRTQAGIQVSETSYGQTAVVANFSCELPHRGTAFQWFREDGVLALLPLPEQQVSIVWSARDDLAERLMGLTGAQLADEVAAASGNVLGPLQLITPPARFTLRCMRVRRLIAPRLALVGDAAHNFHPLAGQGVNVGFQDARELSRVLSERGPERDVGAIALLRRFERARREEIAAMTAATHGLQRLFNHAGTAFAWMRNLGLNLTDRLPPLKSVLVAKALGSPTFHD
jgi:ubiquinone biosynthesis UbiH/UbiF/VisC/COQ6 family hydroxylase